MITVHLHGALERDYGSSYEFLATSPAECIRALVHQIEGFSQSLRKGSYRIVRGDEVITHDLLHFRFGDGIQDMHIVPAVKGAGGRGIGKVIVGTLLIASALAFPAAAGTGLFGGSLAIGAGGVSAATVGSLGSLIALSGVSQMLTPTPQLADVGFRERPEDRPSFLLGGLQNTVEQGLPVPLLYGEVRVGSRPVSAGLSTEAVSLDDILDLEDNPRVNYVLTPGTYTNPPETSFNPDKEFFGYATFGDQRIINSVDRLPNTDNLSLDVTGNNIPIPFGAISSRAFVANRKWYQIIEYDSTEEGEKRLRVSLAPTGAGGITKEWFQKITITDPAGPTVLHSLFTVNAQRFEAPQDLQFSIVEQGAGAHWEWTIPDFTFDSRQGVDLDVEIIYT